MGASLPVIGVIMGSQSDWPVMKLACETLESLGIAHEARIVSAHRTPDRLSDYAKSARERGLKVIIAGAGGAAHLPGMTAAMTPRCVRIHQDRGGATGHNAKGHVKQADRCLEQGQTHQPLDQISGRKRDVQADHHQPDDRPIVCAL